MVVPALAVVEDLHVAHAPFHESARDQAAAPIVGGDGVVDAVEREDVFGF